MASLPKPDQCSCGHTTFKHLFKPERWACASCEVICAERAQRNDPNVCRVCKAPRGSKPFSEWAHICLDCKKLYNEDYNVKNKTQISQQHRESYQRDKQKRIAAVRDAYQRSPKAFIRYLSHSLTRESNKHPRANGRSGRLFKGGGRGLLEVSIDFDYLWALWESQQGRCALTGLHLGHRFNAPLAVSIDRKDSTQGYVPGNVQLVCQWVNRAKNNMSNEDFKSLLLYSREKAEFVITRWSPEDRQHPARKYCQEVAMFLKLVHDRLVAEFWNFPLQIHGEWWSMLVEIGQGSGARPQFRLAWDDVTGSVLGLDYEHPASYGNEGSRLRLHGVDMAEPVAVDLVVMAMGEEIRGTRAL